MNASTTPQPANHGNSTPGSPRAIIPVRPATGEGAAPSGRPASLLRRNLRRQNPSRRTFGKNNPSRRTFGKNNPSRRTFGKGNPSRRTFGLYHPSRRTFGVYHP